MAPRRREPGVRHDRPRVVHRLENRRRRGEDLAYAIGAKLVGVHTLAAIAAGIATRGPERLWTVLDAQRQELFVASFDSAADR